MKSKGLLLLLLITLAYNGVFAKNRSSRPRLRRNDFPEDFIFGSATSAYQCEGAAHEDGRGPSIWDTYSEKFPEKIMDGSNGSVADDSYYLYEEDVNLLHQIGFNAYRFSISWSRILPRGNLKGGINQAGINYYNNLINQLLLKGVKPYVTIFHWDLPEALEVAYGGFLGAEIVNDFRDYAELCFQKFGDRVKHWMTLNEPFTVVKQGYLTGEKAPGRCSSFTNPNCLGGDGATEPYIVGHNFLLAHGAAVKVYREKYQWGASQCVMQWGASMYYAVGSRQTHYIMVLHVFAQPSEERHTVTVQRFRRTSQIRRWRSYPPKPQRCARTHHDRRWSSKCYSRGQNGVHDVVCRWNMIQIFLVFKVFLMRSSFR